MMKKILFLILMVHFIMPVQAQHTLRILSYNIKNANGMDGVCSFQRIANVINQAAPDVVALQELDSMTNRSGHKYVLGEIAERTRMNAYFAPAIDYDGGKYGIGILSKEVPLCLHRVELPGREEARVLILAEFEDYVFCCTHLSLTQEDRMKSLDLLKSAVSGCRKPLFIAGDMNDEPDSDFIKALKKDFEILSSVKPTFPAPDPKKTLDYVASLKSAEGGYALVSTRVLDEPLASDHRPVMVELRNLATATCPYDSL